MDSFFIFFPYILRVIQAELSSRKLEVNGIQYKINATNISLLYAGIPLSAGITDTS